MDDLLVEKILRAVEQVPAGHVVTYGDIGSIVGTGPRQVGWVMSTWGSNVTWWRVTNASGEFPEELRAEAFEHWAAEGILPKANGRGCDIRRYRADLTQLADAWERSVADLPEIESDTPEGSASAAAGRPD